mgnify:CR=1 FL=1
MKTFKIDTELLASYKDIYTPKVLQALDHLMHFNEEVKLSMEDRYKVRAERHAQKKYIGFLDPEETSFSESGRPLVSIF